MLQHSFSTTVNCSLSIAETRPFGMSVRRSKQHVALDCGWEWVAAWFATHTACFILYSTHKPKIEIGLSRSVRSHSNTLSPRRLKCLQLFPSIPVSFNILLHLASLYRSVTVNFGTGVRPFCHYGIQCWCVCVVCVCVWCVYVCGVCWCVCVWCVCVVCVCGVCVVCVWCVCVYVCVVCVCGVCVVCVYVCVVCVCGVCVCGVCVYVCVVCVCVVCVCVVCVCMCVWCVCVP
jgi:GINS complex subunit 2